MRFLKRLICKIGWHGPTVLLFSDGCSDHAMCVWCGGTGMKDSQGNLFAVSRVRK